VAQVGNGGVVFRYFAGSCIDGIDVAVWRQVVRVVLVCDCGLGMWWDGLV